MNIFFGRTWCTITSYVHLDTHWCHGLSLRHGISSLLSVVLRELFSDSLSWFPPWWKTTCQGIVNSLRFWGDSCFMFIHISPNILSFFMIQTYSLCLCRKIFKHIQCSWRRKNVIIAKSPLSQCSIVPWQIHYFNIKSVLALI